MKIQNKKTLHKIKPSIIYFTHSKIRKNFSGCGKRLEDTLNELKTNIELLETIPNITVYTNDGITFYTQNNRRLWIFKELEKLNLLTDIYVNIEPVPNKKMLQNTYSLIAKPILS